MSQKNFSHKIFLVTKNFLSQKNWGHKINFSHKKNFVTEFFYSQKNFSHKNILVKKKDFRPSKHGFLLCSINSLFWSSKSHFQWTNESSLTKQMFFTHLWKVLWVHTEVSDWGFTLNNMLPLLDSSHSSVKRGLQKHGFPAIFCRISSETRFAKTQPYGHALLTTYRPAGCATGKNSAG